MRTNTRGSGCKIIQTAGGLRCSDEISLENVFGRCRRWVGRGSGAQRAPFVVGARGVCVLCASGLQGFWPRRAALCAGGNFWPIHICVSLMHA